MKNAILSTVVILLSLHVEAQQWSGDTNKLTTTKSVGIGETNPNFRLDVASSSFTVSQFRRSGSGGGAVIQIANPLNSKWSLGVGANHHFAIYKSTESFGSQFIISDNGNIGINELVPAYKLEVNAAASDTHARFIGTYAGPQGIQVERSGGDNIRLLANYTGFGGGLTSNSALRFSVNSNSLANPSLFIKSTGEIGIGTTVPNQKLSVNGKINAEEVILEDVAGADFVFEEDYDLRSLEETEKFIQANKHLPEIPSAAEMAEEGLEIKEMNILLLQKVEELTLHLIQQNKEIKALREEVSSLKNE